MKLGLPSSQTELDELIQLLLDREQDHRNWLAELESCVREGRPFKMARDPHVCKFGQWYDHYQTENSLFKMVLKKMDAPHQIIHATASEALQKTDAGDQSGALSLLTERRNHELAVLVSLFAEARAILKYNQRELAVVLCRGHRRFAISIDGVESVERIPDGSIEPMSAALAGQSEMFQWQIGKRAKSNQTILLPDEGFLFQSEKASPALARLTAI